MFDLRSVEGPARATRNREAWPAFEAATSQYAGGDEDIALLLAAGIAPALVAEALPRARQAGVPVHRVLVAEGMVAADSYVAGLAACLGPHVTSWPSARRGAAKSAIAAKEASLPFVAVEATGPAPSEVRRRCREIAARGQRVVLVPAHRIEEVERPAERRQRLIAAANALRRAAPLASAGVPTSPWQKAATGAIVGTVIGALIVAPELTATAVLALLALPFLCVVVLRLAALAILLVGGASTRQPPPPLTDAELPSYAVLVPLYREAAVLPDLVAALARLDYPAAKLDIVLALEASDIESRAAVELIELPPFMRAIIVPDALPRTKPKALNYALSHARGEMVVVYDAEDIPEPDQLRRAAALMRASNVAVGCVQARLAIDNADEGFIARQFALEYTALFDAVLPALSRLGIPVPLGGTSNHFPRAVIEAVGGWDPFNVTEDAELGIRLARRRLAVLVLESTTWEEAPTTAGVWLRQRTRWIKGWMQTWLVQMRDPLACSRELGLDGFIGLQVLMGGLVLSALVHPLFYLLVAAELLREAPFQRPDDGLGQAVWMIAAFNLAAGYLSAMALAAVAALRRGRYREALAVPAMPLYWLAISVAAYRALVQLAYAPHLWEKTAHGSTRRRVSARVPAPGATPSPRADGSA